MVLDEAYAEFAPLTHRLAVDRYPNLILLRTFSKALASAGWRLGYLVGAPELVAPAGRPAAALQHPRPRPWRPWTWPWTSRPPSPGRPGNVPERRERLAAALGDRVAAGQRGQLPVPAPRPRPGAARGRASSPGPCRSWAPGRITVGTEDEARRDRRGPGRRPGRRPRPRPPRRLLALDMDGVLVDGDPGFMNAVAKALGELAPGLPWMDAHYLAFKQVGGFNNDYRVCAAALALAERGRAGQPVDRPGHRLPAPGGAHPGAGAPLRRGGHPLVQVGAAPGHPLVTRAELEALGWDLAVLTGRNYEEMESGFEVLGFRLPAVADGAPHLRKPMPGGLLQLADAFQAEEIVFVGDTRDDAQALRAAREARPDLVWTFAAVGPNRATPSPGKGTCAPPASGPC